MLTDDEKTRVVESLQALIADARRQKLWLYCFYQGLWFSPDELEQANAKGDYLWGAESWELLDPTRELNRLQDAITAAKNAHHQFKKRLGLIGYCRDCQDEIELTALTDDRLCDVCAPR